MNYELAKQLKDAGYPMKTESMLSPSLPDRAGFLKLDNRSYINVGDNWYAVPDLSELIEACRDVFAGVKRERPNGTWYAFSFGTSFSTGVIAESMKTPEDAVARLWLALHNSK
jgi:hypothetical protein